MREKKKPIFLLLFARLLVTLQPENKTYTAKWQKRQQ
jgi:hypothetical protein